MFFFLPENLGCYSVRGHLRLLLIQRGYETDFSFLYPRSKSFSLVPNTSFRLLLVISPVIVENRSTIGIAVDVRVSDLFYNAKFHC